MTIQPTRSTHPTAVSTTAPTASDRAAKPAAPSFTRAPVDGGRPGAPVSSVRDRNPPPGEMAGDVRLVLDAASRRLQPGQSMRVTVKDMDMVLYRTTKRDGLVLQSIEDYNQGKSSGLYMGFDDQRQLVMNYDMQPVSPMNGNYDTARRCLASLKLTLGIGA